MAGGAEGRAAVPNVRKARNLFQLQAWKYSGNISLEPDAALVDVEFSEKLWEGWGSWIKTLLQNG